MRQELTQEILNTVRFALNEIHTAIPGKVKKFDDKKCQADIKLLGKYGTSEGYEFEFPDLNEVPVMFPYSTASGCGIYFPVKPGDICLVLISETDLDTWLYGSDSEGNLRYDLSNAVCIPGMLKKGNGLIKEAVDNEAVIITAGDVKLSASMEKKTAVVSVEGTSMTVSASGIAIRGDLNVNGNISCTGIIK